MEPKRLMEVFNFNENINPGPSYNFLMSTSLAPLDHPSGGNSGLSEEKSNLVSYYFREDW